MVTVLLRLWDFLGSSFRQDLANVDSLANKRILSLVIGCEKKLKKMSKRSNHVYMTRRFIVLLCTYKAYSAATGKKNQKATV